jgi:hypothetical protein
MAPSEVLFLPGANDMFEASTIASLHSEVTSLNVSFNHYARWRNVILLMLQRYALDDHVTFDAVAFARARWWLMDNVVLSWLFGILTVDPSDIVREHSGATR